MLEHVARIREVVRAICGGHVLAVEHPGLGDLGSPGRHLDRGGRNLEADAPFSEAAAPRSDNTPPSPHPTSATAPGELIPIVVAS